MRVIGGINYEKPRHPGMQVGSMLDLVGEKKEKNPRTHTRKVITKTVKSKRIMNYIA